MFYSSFHLLDVDCTISIYMRERAVIDMYRVWPNICCVDICLVLRKFAPYSKQFVQTRCRWWRRDVFSARVPCNLLPTNTDYIYICTLKSLVCYVALIDKYRIYSACIRVVWNLTKLFEHAAHGGVANAVVVVGRGEREKTSVCGWKVGGLGDSYIYIYKLEKTRRGAWNRWFAQRAARKLLDIRAQTTCWWLVWTVCQVAARWCSGVYIYIIKETRAT